MIEVFPEPLAPRTIIQYLGFGDCKLLLSELVVLQAELSSMLDDSLLCVRDDSLDLIPELIRLLDCRLENISRNFEGVFALSVVAQVSQCDDVIRSLISMVL